MQSLEGLDQLKAALLGLPAAIEKQALRRAAVAGARIVRDQVKVNAPLGSRAHKRGGLLVAPGALKRAALVKYAPEKSSKDSATYLVTMRRGKAAQASNRDAYYWIWVEKGHRYVARGSTSLRSRRSTQATSGKRVSPHPFFVPAYRATAQRALTTMRETLTTVVADILKNPKA